MDTLRLEQVNRHVLAKQHLTPQSHIDDVVAVADNISGLHATGTREPYLALFSRTNRFIPSQLDLELNTAKRLMKLRAMRGTLYIVTGNMSPLVFAALGAMLEKNALRFAEFRGVSDDAARSMTPEIIECLKGRELTAPQLAKEMATGFNLPALLNLLCDRGILVRVTESGWTSRSYYYALFSDYYPGIDLKSVGEKEALTQMVKRHLRSFGPATEDDTAWWLGLTKSAVRPAFASLDKELVRVAIGGLDGEFIMLRDELSVLTNQEMDKVPTLNFLPMLDPYLMGYRRRERYIKTEQYSYIFDRTGNVTSTILLNGRVEGIWDYVKEPPCVKVYLFTQAGDEVKGMITEAAQRLGQFITGRAVEVRYVTAMTPLSSRPPGGFMSPLRD